MRRVSAAVTSLCLEYTLRFVLPVLIILMEFLVILGLCTLMLVVQPVVTLALAGICGIAMAGYQFPIGKRISMWIANIICAD